MSKTKCPFPSFSLLPPTRLLPHLTMSMQLVECFMRNGNWLPFKTIWVPPGLMMGSVLLVVLVFCVVFVFVLFLVPTVACHSVILHCSEVYLVYVTERLASKLVYPSRAPCFTPAFGGVRVAHHFSSTRCLLFVFFLCAHLVFTNICY